MKAIFVGASPTAIMTAKSLLARNHEVIIIERDKEKIDTLTTEFDCGFLHGDGSKPSILRETNPQEDDMLFCLTGHDQTNIIASLVGRSLGFDKVVTKIEDPSYEHICIELGLEATIIPSRTISRHLADMFEGRDSFELSTMFRYDASTISFVARQQHAGAINELELPKSSRIICIYRNEKLIIPQEAEEIEEGDEVIVITYQKNLEELHAQLDLDSSNKKKVSPE
ncbi:TRK system potassium uptake protein TrkA [Thiomicrorhabdus immobilis]|uniref:Trk system potassium uptake protein TrkA n=1 Tax=Thiomicrorhabdus immobilis TaxID=2791037 RepID=A0ABN6CWT3_9GAMM|nr:NAD-binding protein [Thiomicrorhabdus immobilis]BCN93508.1 TRK system potassium uptake protein TrkA [Thiomicrorhabdus immobilis]